jgi:hypothetical protein
MYTGTLIEDLIATVERAEQHARQSMDPAELERWYAATENEPDLLGVA